MTASQRTTVPYRACLLLTIAGFVLAGCDAPRSAITDASSERGIVQESASAPSTPASSKDGEYLVICSLRTRSETIIILSGPHGPLYSVKDKSGQLIVSQATEEELQANHPLIYQRLDRALAGIEWAGLEVSPGHERPLRLIEPRIR